MNVSEEAGYIAKLLDYSWVAVLGLVGIVYKSNSQRLDEVAKTAAAALTRKEFEVYAESTKCSRRSMKDSVAVLNEGQAKLLEAVSRIEGKLEK
jgi:hypothetical protein